MILLTNKKYSPVNKRKEKPKLNKIITIQKPNILYGNKKYKILKY